MYTMELMKIYRIILIVFSILTVPGITIEIMMIIKKEHLWEFINTCYWDTFSLILFFIIGGLIYPKKDTNEQANASMQNNSQIVLNASKNTQKDTAIDISVLFKNEPGQDS